MLWYIARPCHYLVRVVRRRLDFPALKKLIIACADETPGADILIEDRASGIQLIQDLRAETAICPIAVSPESDKVTRMAVRSAKIEAGKVWLPKTAQWLADFQAEMRAFPDGAHDDQVDSVSQFLAWAARHASLEDDWKLY